MMVGIILPIFTVYVMNIVKLLPLTAATVSPALVEPIPVVITDREEIVYWRTSKSATCPYLQFVMFASACHPIP